MPVRGLDKVGRLTKQAIPMGKINKPSRDYPLGSFLAHKGVAF
jgi:hypothetical protein